MNMDGRVVIVTGAGAGLGRAHALAFAQHGARVVVNDPGRALSGAEGDSAAADKVVAEIRQAGGQAVANYESVASADGARKIAATAMDTWGRIDTLVNNAGILRDRSFAKLDLADFEAVLQVHLMGSVYCTHAVWPTMMEQKSGRIVMTTSIAGTSGNFGQAAYATAKMGMLGLMNTLAIEGAKNDILVNAVSPAGTTRMTQGLSGAGGNAETRERYMRAELVSPAVLWLGSADCNVTAHIVTAAAGGYGRVHYFETEGVQFDPSNDVTPEMFASAVPDAFDLDTATPTTPGVKGLMGTRLARIGVTF